MTSTLEVNQILAHWEFFKMIEDVRGVIVECGVFRGRNLLRFAQFRRALGNSRRLIGFDTFDVFPEATGEDISARQRFIDRNGDKSSSVDEIHQLLYGEDCGDNTTLIKGDICETVPEFVKRHPDISIALINMDVDLYEPAQVILEHLFPMLSDGGILIADDYDIFPGETRAVDEFCGEHNASIQCLPLFRGYYLKREQNDNS